MRLTGWAAAGQCITGRSSRACRSNFAAGRVNVMFRPNTAVGIQSAGGSGAGVQQRISLTRDESKWPRHYIYDRATVGAHVSAAAGKGVLIDDPLAACAVGSLVSFSVWLTPGRLATRRIARPVARLSRCRSGR